MKRRLIAILLAGTSTILCSSAFAQADPKNSGYWLESYGPADNNVWRSGGYGGQKGVNDTLCWRFGYFTPAMAIPACDPSLATTTKPVATQTSPTTAASAAPAHTPARAGPA